MPLGRSEGGNFDLCNFCLALSLGASPQAERERGGGLDEGERASEKGLHLGRGHIAAEGDGGLYEYKCILLQHLPAPWPIKCLVSRKPFRSECSVNSCTCGTSGRLVMFTVREGPTDVFRAGRLPA
jgi:hypothetical protein